jgi:hypothetical protein
MLGIGAAAFAFASYLRVMKQAELAWDKVAAAGGAQASDESYDSASVRHLPEVAQRYFNHAIATGTPLKSVIELQMKAASRSEKRATSRSTS